MLINKMTLYLVSAPNSGFENKFTLVTKGVTKAALAKSKKILL